MIHFNILQQKIKFYSEFKRRIHLKILRIILASAIHPFAISVTFRSVSNDILEASKIKGSLVQIAAKKIREQLYLTSDSPFSSACNDDVNEGVNCSRFEVDEKP